MALIDWKDAFSVGIEDVDHEHQTLIALINELHDGIRRKKKAPKATVARFLGEINAKIAAHFALEETIMRRENYASYAAHKADHDRLLDDLRDIMAMHDRDQYFEYEAVLAEHLRDWFTVHFRTHDTRLHRIVSTS